jgi:hypothetical protein
MEGHRRLPVAGAVRVVTAEHLLDVTKDNFVGVGVHVGSCARSDAPSVPLFSDFRQGAPNRPGSSLTAVLGAPGGRGAFLLRPGAGRAYARQLLVMFQPFSPNRYATGKDTYHRSRLRRQRRQKFNFQRFGGG